MGGVRDGVAIGIGVGIALVGAGLLAIAAVELATGGDGTTPPASSIGLIVLFAAMIWWGIQIGGSLQSYPGAVIGAPTATIPNSSGTNWLLTPTTRYDANCVGPCTPNGLVIPTLTEASLTVPLRQEDRLDPSLEELEVQRRRCRLCSRSRRGRLLSTQPGQKQNNERHKGLTSR